MSIDRLHSNARMSQAVIHNGTVYLAGQIAADKAQEGAGEQAQAILVQIDSLLAEAGSSKASLLSATIWLTDMADFAAVNAAWDAWVADAGKPARATVGGAQLALPGLKVEIAVTAAVAG